jgi:hypothetical protein
MINDRLIIQNIAKTTHQSLEIRNETLEIESILDNIYCYIEMESEKDLVFHKKDMLYKRIDALQIVSEEIQTMPNNGDFPENPLRLVKNEIELMELIVKLHKNAAKRNDACKRYSEMVCGMCYWLLKECKHQKIKIPFGYKLSKMIEKEGFVIQYPKPTGLLQDKEPTFDVTECCYWLCFLLS